MATYFVEVNNHFMVRIEHDGSCGGAEHHFLDNYNGVWGALAYDAKMMKTDCFRGALLRDELITEEALAVELDKIGDLAGDVMEADWAVNNISEEIKELEKKVTELYARRAEAKTKFDEAKAKYEAQETRCNAKRPQ